VKYSEPPMLQMPPPEIAAEFAESVLSLTVRLPRFTMAPP